MKKIISFILSAIFLSTFLLTSCAVDQGVEPSYLGSLADIELNLTVFTTNTGIFPQEGWDSVMNDPSNPFKSGIGGDPNAYEDGTVIQTPQSEKWLAGGLTGNNYAVARFYCWATALSSAPSGENQFYCALALENLFTSTGASLFRDMAVRAYEAVLLNFWNDMSDSTGSGDFVYIGTWAFDKLITLGGDTHGFTKVTGTPGAYLVPPANLAK